MAWGSRRVTSCGGSAPPVCQKKCTSLKTKTKKKVQGLGRMETLQRHAAMCRNRHAFKAALRAVNVTAL